MNEIRITLSLPSRCLAEDILEFVSNIRDEDEIVIVSWRDDEGDHEVRTGYEEEIQEVGEGTDILSGMEPNEK